MDNNRFYDHEFDLSEEHTEEPADLFGPEKTGYTSEAVAVTGNKVIDNEIISADAESAVVNDAVKEFFGTGEKKEAGGEPVLPEEVDRLYDSAQAAEMEYYMRLEYEAVVSEPDIDDIYPGSQESEPYYFTEEEEAYLQEVSDWYSEFWEDLDRSSESGWFYSDSDDDEWDLF